MTVLPFAANQPGVVPGLGFWSRAGVTNKCSNHNANPNGSLANMSKGGDAAATLTEVDDTAQLQIAGLFGTDRPCANGKVFKLDNSTGTAVATAIFAGTVGNTNPHTSSVYFRGSGRAYVGVSATNGPDIVLTSGYQRATVTGTPTGTGAQSFVGARPGAVVFFILNQLVEGSQAGPIIVTAGAVASVGADILQLAPPITTEEDFVMWATADLRSNPEQLALVNLSDGTTGNRISVFKISGGNLDAAVASGGTVQSVGRPTGSGNIFGRCVLLLRRSSGNWTFGYKKPDGTVAVGVPAAGAFPVGINRFDVGSLLTGSQTRSPIEFVGIRKGPFSDADIIAILQAA